MTSTLSYVEWWAASPRGTWVARCEWTFPSRLNFGQRWAWGFRSSDEHALSGPFETLCEAWKWAEEGR